MVLLRLFFKSKLFCKSPSFANIVRACSKDCAVTEEKEIDTNKTGLVLGVYQCNDTFELTPTAEEFNQKSGGKIAQHLNELKGRLKLGRAYVLTDVVPEYSAVAISSYGPKDAGYNELEALDEARENIRWGVGAGVKALQHRGVGDIRIATPRAQDAAAESAELAAWRFEEFRAKDSILPPSKLSLFGSEGKKDWDIGVTQGRAQNWARYLSDMPANKMTPVDLAQAALDTLCPLGVKVEVRERDWIESQKMEAFLTVARGSCEEPIFLECMYKGAKDNSPPVLIAAKGVTFDSGGLCLKKREKMVENRGSMAGAAVTLAVIKMLAELKVPINVGAAIPMCENMVSGQCMKVGDVVRALNGLSIQVEDTDMEGRLMLADALVHAQTTLRPALVLVIATLTKGVQQATGGGAFGCFSNDEQAWRALRHAGAGSGDRPWRFPLWDYYRHQVTDCPAVDLRNKGSGKATACLGAAFIRHFVCGPWMQLDITGVGKLARVAPPYLSPRRMSGRPTRTVAKLLTDIATSTNTDKLKQ